MNDIDYLNQISASTSKPANAGFFSNPLFKVLTGAAIALFAIIFGLLIYIASIPTETTVNSELTRLYWRAETLNQTLSTYNTKVKSSSLRAAGSSLSTVLTELSTNSASSLEEFYGISASDSSMSTEDSELIKKTNTTLERAELNGLLDRYYASEISYQISHLLVLENLILSKNPNESISSYIKSSKSSLENLGKTFQNSGK